MGIENRYIPDYLKDDQEPEKEIVEKLKEDVEKIKAGLTFSKTSSGRNRKQAIGIRLDPEIIAYFQEAGHGWQTRMNEVLREYITGQKLKLDRD